MTRTWSLGILLLIFTQSLRAQTIFVNAVTGSDDSPGTESQPVQTLPKAVALARQSSPAEPVRIKVSPGLYTLTDQLKIEGRNAHDSARYILEAAVMPDDKQWQPPLMPVIQSVSANNDYKYFPKCAGVLVDRGNVCIRGLKFLGNANPATDYYYPIEKDSGLLNNLEVSQCLFVGEKNGVPVQGAIYTEGAGLTVDHCIFYNCKNAVLTFFHTSRFSLTHSIIYGAYEAAVWYGYSDQPEEPFTFSNNVVSHCHYFWAGWKGDHPTYTFSNSLLCENENYIGFQNGDGGVVAANGTVNYKENALRRTGKVLLVEVKTEGMPHDYLSLAPESDGKDLDVGIFKLAK